MHIRATQLRSAALGIATSVSIGAASMILAPVAAEEQATARTESPLETVRLSTTTVPLQVSGLVGAANEAIVYARIAGVITNLPVAEGSQLVTGALVSQQATPVEDANVAVAVAEQNLSLLTREEAREVQQISAEQATGQQFTAEAIAELRTQANTKRITEASDKLWVTLQDSLVTALDVANYVNHHRYLFTADGLREYDQVLANLYGRVPTYFQGGISEPVESVIDLQNQLAAAVDNSIESVLLRQTAATVLERQFDAMTNLLKTAERDVFSRGEQTASDTDREGYLAKRSATVAAQQSLQSAAAEMAQVLDTAATETVTRGSAATVTAQDAAIAELQSAYATRIAAASDVKQQAHVAASVAAQAEGQITAPFGGEVSAVHVDLGEYVQPGTPLITLTGSEARELEVSVPATFLSSLAAGQPLLVDRVEVGRVDRFSSAQTGNSVLVICSLTEPTLSVGESVRGVLLLEPAAAVYTVPRQYVHFTTHGPVIVYDTEETEPVEIVYDTGTHFFLRVAHPRQLPLLSADSITL